MEFTSFMQGVMLGGGSSGGGSGSGYADDGLVFREINLLGMLQKNETFASVSFTNCTIEICFSVSALLGYGGIIGRLFSFAGEVFLLSADSQVLGTGSDYGLQVFYGDEYNATALIPINGLTFGADKHTYTITQSGTRTNVYFDGVLVGGYDNLNGRTTMASNYAYFVDPNFPLTGMWYDMRVYNRALSADEIAANHAEDMRLYGSAA